MQRRGQLHEYEVRGGGVEVGWESYVHELVETIAI